MSKSKCKSCKSSCRCPQGAMGPMGLMGLAGATGPTGPSGGPTGPTGPSGGDAFLASNFVSAQGVVVPALTNAAVVAFLTVGTTLPNRFLQIFTTFSVTANAAPAFVIFQVRVNGILQPELSRITINTAGTPGGDSGPLNVQVAVPAGTRLVELLASNQSATAVITVDATLLVLETLT